MSNSSDCPALLAFKGRKKKINHAFEGRSGRRSGRGKLQAPPTAAPPRSGPVRSRCALYKLAGKQSGETFEAPHCLWLEMAIGCWKFSLALLAFVASSAAGNDSSISFQYYHFSKVLCAQTDVKNIEFIEMLAQTETYLVD